MTHPYSNLNDYNFWRRAVTLAAFGSVDPCIDDFRISPTARIASMGSCFAQHLARNISKSGFNYFVAEKGDGLEISEAERRNFGIFSARYGNIYTAKQAVQLFDRAFKASDIFGENIWMRGDVFVDAFRPTIEPNGYQSREALIEDRDSHLRKVRDVFEKSDWIIFTLGLTEAWRSKIDGAIFPVAPGVSGGTFDESQHEFLNFKVNEVIADLELFVKKVTDVNPNINFLLTVSPVPLIATYEKRHVLVSTTISKSILRVAVDEIQRKFANVFYFPSYEIITAPSNGNRYFEDDLRAVKNEGVNHVMRVFARHFMFSDKQGTQFINDNKLICGAAEIICDEDQIEQTLKMAGFSQP